MDARLRGTALKVIHDLKRIPDYAGLELAIIGGLARMHYAPKARVTPDVDFIVVTDELITASNIKRALLDLPGSDFRQPADVFQREYVTSGGDIEYHQVDFVASALCPYRPPAVRMVQDIPRDVIPYISITDLIVFKISSCGMRADKEKGSTDADDAEDLLGVTGPLTLTPEQQTAVEKGIEGVIGRHSRRTRSWWRTQLGLPENDDGEGGEEGEEEGEE
ncbi:hypothetical protein C8A00DRAFT_33693 [Chaetomidium leptoderma]|uniref:Uncharacterized protein n=1 Tax=Chaetomidium leptoderma TaxID=669021 RepID=A0AAN6ZWJ5_9PEZI|nr:hypothetical protein C8A00DRAFT_33693 [Chaetomidium leptoderma]